MNTALEAVNLTFSSFTQLYQRVRYLRDTSGKHSFNFKGSGEKCKRVLMHKPLVGHPM